MGFHDFLVAFLFPGLVILLFYILLWVVRGSLSLVRRDNVQSPIQGRIRYTKNQPMNLSCGRFLGEGCSGIIYEATWSRERNISSPAARNIFPAVSTRSIERNTSSLAARKAFLAVPVHVFKHEAVRLVKLDHPNIVKVLDWTVDRRSCSLFMDRMKYDLFSVVQKRKEAMRNGAKVKFSSTVPIPLHEAVHIMLQIAEGMKYMHDQGLAHGDLKPNNILVDAESGLMVVKVTDFGLTETKKRSTTLVSNRARCLQILKWKAPELFENLLGFFTEESGDMWTEMLEVVKTLPASSAVTMGSADSKMQLADVYSFALTCSYILGAQVPYDSNLALTELRNGISSGARPHLPFECPKVLASLISQCWDPICSRRPAFIDICKEMRIVKWELKQIEDKMQEYRNSKPQGLRKGGLYSYIFLFSKGGNKGSVAVCLDEHNRLKSVGNILHISKEISDHVPQVRHHMLSNMTRAWTELGHSTTMFTGFVERVSDEYLDQGKKLEKLKAHTEGGHFFFDFNEGGLEMKERFASGSWSILYEGKWRRDDGKFHSVAIKTFRDCDFTIAEPVMHFFNTKGTEANLRTSRVLLPFGGTLLKNGGLALVYERCWGDLRKLIDIQMLKNKDVEMPPFKQEMAIDIMLQIAEGVVELQEFGIVHRDVKAMNVLVRDFKKYSKGGSHGSISCAVIDYEVIEGVWGTRFWRAPEVLYGFQTHTLAKLKFVPPMAVYSYGMTCYEILTGKRPLEHLSPKAYDIVLKGERPELPARLHPELRDLVEKCWDANPSKRPTFQEIVLLLITNQTGN